MRLIPKSWKPLNHVPSQVKPPAREPSSSAVVMVGPGVGLAPLLVPSQGCAPDPSLVSVLALVVTIPSNTVALDPSMRRWTVAGAAFAAEASTLDPASTSRRRRPVRATRED